MVKKICRILCLMMGVIFLSVPAWSSTTDINYGTFLIPASGHTGLSSGLRTGDFIDTETRIQNKPYLLARGRGGGMGSGRGGGMSADTGAGTGAGMDAGTGADHEAGYGPGAGMESGTDHEAGYGPGAGMESGTDHEAGFGPGAGMGFGTAP